MTAFTTLKIAVLAPMPIASERMMTAASVGWRRSCWSAWRTSFGMTEEAPDRRATICAPPAKTNLAC